jgi:signal transduction histidine kinase
VIFLTARTDTESIVRGFDVGGVDYITKPFNEAELLARVKTHLKLKQNDTQLRELNAAKDKFFSIIAHDLRSPFNSLIVGLDLLIQSYDTLSEDKKKEYLEMMKKTSYNTLNLLNNLLTWSRSQIGCLACNPDIIHVRNIAEETLVLMNKNAMNKNIRLINRIEENTLVYADMNMITTVVRNLVSNAVKYTTDGGTIIISAKEIGDTWEISISDSGVGIKPEYMRKLFRIDFSHSTPGTAREQGTGLGLNLCKEFVERNSGKIGVESEVGKGSRFYFTLPKPLPNESAYYHKFPESLISPSQEDLEHLIGFAGIGDIHAIRQEADVLMRKDRQLIPFAEELRRLAKEFQIGKIRIFLKSFQKTMPFSP